MIKQIRVALDAVRLLQTIPSISGIKNSSGKIGTAIPPSNVSVTPRIVSAQTKKSLPNRDWGVLYANASDDKHRA